MKATLDIANLFPLVKRKTTTKTKDKIKTKHTRLFVELDNGITIEEKLLVMNGQRLDVKKVKEPTHDYETIIDGETHKLRRSWLILRGDKSVDTSTLTVLSFGGGQDSTTLLHLIEQDEEFCLKYANGRVLVIMADTGNEHPETDNHVKRIMEKTNLEFVFVTPEMGYHHENWWDLETRYRSNNSIGSKAYPKTCTDNLKLQPIYKFLEDWIERNYGFKAGKKNGLKEFAKHYGKINMMIGIAAGEEGRMAPPQDVNPDFHAYLIEASEGRAEAKVIAAEKKAFKDRGEKWKGKKVKYTPAGWKTAAINMQYPLVDLGLDRAGCQEKIKELGHEVPVPSNCIMCPFMDDVELIWLERFLPEEFEKWCELEQNKFDANEYAGDRNLGVWGKWNKAEGRPYSLRDALKDAKEKHGDLTDEYIEDYKMSHGHCIMSQY